MKQILGLVGLLLVFPFAMAAGPILSGTETGNGGDPCESQIELLLLDIDLWIGQGGHLALDLPEDLPHEQYKEKMTKAIEKIKSNGIHCTSDRLYIRSFEKTCINEDFKVVCNNTRVSNTSIADLYMLTHHEIAGAAGLESNDGSETSKYRISWHLPTYTNKQSVTRLSIPNNGSTFDKLASAYAQRYGKANFSEFQRQHAFVIHNFPVFIQRWMSRKNHTMLTLEIQSLTRDKDERPRYEGYATIEGDQICKFVWPFDDRDDISEGCF